MGVILNVSMSAPAKGMERRGAPRTAFGGKSVVQIEVSGCEPIMACLWDLSSTGACLLFPTHIHAPDIFKINFDKMPRQARVIWRKESFVGVAFTDDRGQ
jgi:hypothetical protein